MTWWKKDSKIPYENSNFVKLINCFVFECPASIRQPRKENKKNIYKPVSRRGLSFKERGIESSLLRTILSKISKPIISNNAYASLSVNINLETEIEYIMRDNKLSDKSFDLIVFHKRHDMPDTEAIYYYIRNAFAHGSFEVKRMKGGFVYYIESSKNDVVRDSMRLQERTLLYYVELAKMSAREIKDIQKKKRR